MKGFLGDSQIKVELEATEDNAKEQGVSSHEAEVISRLKKEV